jgi:hypothetical protein
MTPLHTVYIHMPPSPPSSSRPVPISPPSSSLLRFLILICEVSKPPLNHMLNHDLRLPHLPFNGPHLLALYRHEIHQLCHAFLLHQPVGLPEMILRIADEEKELGQEKEKNSEETGEKRKETRGERREERDERGETRGKRREEREMRNERREEREMRNERGEKRGEQSGRGPLMGSHHLFEIRMWPLMLMIYEAVAEKSDRIAIHPISHLLHRTVTIDNISEHESN